MTKFRNFLMVGCILILGGCASTQVIEQSSNLADAGIKYAEAIDILLDVTADTIIVSDSKMLLYQQKLTVIDPPKEQRDTLRRYIVQNDKVLEALLSTLGEFKRHSRVLKAYFVNLQALAGTDAPQRTAAAVADLSSSINAANQSIQDSGGNLISADEQQALSGLAGLIATGVQASKLRSALERDAAIIGEQLLLHEKLLAKLAGDLQHASNRDFVQRKKNEVHRPYIRKEIRNKDTWIATRQALLKYQFFEKGLDVAVAASRQMRLVWEGIVEGKQDANSITLLLSDLDAFVAVAKQLKEAA